MGVKRWVKRLVLLESSFVLPSLLVRFWFVHASFTSYTPICGYLPFLTRLPIMHVYLRGGFSRDVDGRWSWEISMKRFRAVLAATVALIFYTVTDIMIWQRIFEANNMIRYADTYHTGWFATLAGYAVMGTILLWGSWKDCFFFVTSLFVAAFSGLEDILYYVLDGKLMPEALPWLDQNPMIFATSREGVIFSVVFWLAALALLYYFLYWWKDTEASQ